MSLGAEKLKALNRKTDQLIAYNKKLMESPLTLAHSQTLQSIPSEQALWEQRVEEFKDFVKWLKAHPKDYRPSKLQKEVIQKAPSYGYYTTETSVAYLIPEIWASEIWGRILDKSVIRGLAEIVNFTGPGDKLHIPTTTAGMTSKTRGESTTTFIDLLDDATQTTHGEKLLTKVKHFVTTFITPEAIQDSSYDVLGMITREMADAIRVGEEEAFIQGDTGTYSAPDVKSMFDGMIHDAGQTQDVGSAPLTNEDFTEGMALLGDNKFEPDAFICTRRVFNRFLDATEFEHVLTLDKYGRSATVLQGELARLYNVPILVSDGLPITAGSPDISTCMMIDRRGPVIGNVTQLEMQKEFWPRYQVHFMVLIQRLGYVTRYPNAIVKLTNVYEKP